MNEKGSSLIVVLLITMIFSILGLSILSAAVNNVNRTEIRELEVGTTISGKALMSEVLAQLQYNLNPNNFSDPSLNVKVIQGILKENDTPYPVTTVFEDKLEGIITETKNKFSSGVQIEELDEEEYKKYIDISAPDTIDTFKNNNFTRIYKISISNSGTDGSGPTINKTLTQNVILSPTPSFLNYAVGSYGKYLDEHGNSQDVEYALTINGSPDIVGNVFAPSIETNARAGFFKEVGGAETPDITEPFNGPSIFGTLFLNETNLNVDFFKGSFKEVVTDQVIDGIPALKPTGDGFVDMNFGSTFKRKLGETPIDFSLNPNYFDQLKSKFSSSEHFRAAFDTGSFNKDFNYEEPVTEDPIEINKFWDDISDLSSSEPIITCTSCGSETLYLIEKDFSDRKNFSLEGTTPGNMFFTDIETSGGAGSIINGINKKTLILNKSLTLENDNWLIVDGNLKIVTGTESDPVNIVGNILVTGNFTIVGKCNKEEDLSCSEKNTISFDSTVYANGTGTIYDTNIGGVNNKGLVLLTKGKLTISRIDEFEPVEENKESLITKINKEPPALKAFFYTEDEATLFGVGSRIEIEGGIFARKSLTINAIRGKVDWDEHKLNLRNSKGKDPEFRSSRFFVEYDPRVITSQLNALPRVDRLQMIPDSLIIE